MTSLSDEYPGGIDTPPTDYGSWLQCFEIISKTPPTKETVKLLSNGSFTAYEMGKAYFHTELQKAVNNMIELYIGELNREIRRYSEYNQVDGLHIPFIRFASKYNNCMFFMDLDFLDSKFKAELAGSVLEESDRFWRNILKSLKAQVEDSRYLPLEDEYFRISRIILLKDYR